VFIARANDKGGDAGAAYLAQQAGYLAQQGQHH
jgi:hypothetical protein